MTAPSATAAAIATTPFHAVCPHKCWGGNVFFPVTAAGSSGRWNVACFGTACNFAHYSFPGIFALNRSLRFLLFLECFLLPFFGSVFGVCFVFFCCSALAWRTMGSFVGPLGSLDFDFTGTMKSPHKILCRRPFDDFLPWRVPLLE